MSTIAPKPLTTRGDLADNCEVTGEQAAHVDAPPRLSAHPRLIELVRIAEALGRATAEIVTIDGDRAQVVASLGRHILQPRRLTSAERELGASTAAHQVFAHGVSFAVRDRHRRLVACLSFAGEVAADAVDGLHAIARLVAELLDAGEYRPGAALAEALVDGVRDAIVVVDANFVFRFASRAVGSILGRTAVELVGSSALDLLHPDDVALAFDALLRLADGREVYRTVVRLRHGSGEYVRVEVTGNDLSDDPCIGGIVLCVRSGDRDLELADELDHERSLLAAVLDQLHDGIVATDRFGAVTLVNQAARKVHGLTSAADDLALDALRLLDADGNPLDGVDHPITRVCAGETIVAEPVSVVREGEVRHVRVSGRPIVGALGAALGGVVSYHDVTDAVQVERELRARTLHDQLTGLPNRRQLHERLVALAGDDPDGMVGVCFIDLDGFKLVNDTLGHRAGDEAVREAARRLSRRLRRGQFLARLGGDEFVAVVAGVRSPAEALAVAERLRRAMRAPIDIGTASVTLTASIGLAYSSVAALDEDALLRDADIALYAAKARGRNRVEMFDEQLAAATECSQRQHEMLRNALDRDGLVMHFQPLVDCDAGTIVGYEALARCRLPNGTLVPPSGFLDAAVSSGLVCELDRKAFDQSCAAAAVLQRVRPSPPFVMSCNFSALSVAQAAFVDEVLGTIGRHGLDPGSICVEITESTAFDAGNVAIDALRLLRDRGVHLALDDFGTGYSSLAHLRDLPLATVKVDRSFVARLEGGRTERAIIEAIVRLAETLDLAVVAEGVETADQLARVRELGFRIVQGHYFSPARPLAEVIDQMTSGELLPRPFA